MVKLEFDRNSHICTCSPHDHWVVTKLSQSLCSKAVQGWFRVYVSGGGGGGGWGIYKSGLQGRLEAVEH